MRPASLIDQSFLEARKRCQQQRSLMGSCRSTPRTPLSGYIKSDTQKHCFLGIAFKGTLIQLSPIEVNRAMFYFLFASYQLLILLFLIYMPNTHRLVR